jgi:hypothetical protein
MLKIVSLLVTVTTTAALMLAGIMERIAASARTMARTMIPILSHATALVA